MISCLHYFYTRVARISGLDTSIHVDFEGIDISRLQTFFFGEFCLSSELFYPGK